MSTSRPFGYNTGNTISGTEQYGNLVVGVDNIPYSEGVGGVKWWNGADEDLGYVIASVNVDENHNPLQPTPNGSELASVSFYRTEGKNDNSFIELSNYLSSQNFDNPFVSKNWLLSNGYWTSWNQDVITDGLVLYLDAANPDSYIGTGTTWNDLSGEGNNGTLVNGTAYSTDNWGCFNFDGINDYVDIPSTSLNFVNQPITLSAFVKINTLGSEGGRSIFFSKDRNTGGNRYTQLHINPSDKIRLLLQNGTYSVDFTGDGPNIGKEFYQMSVTITSETIILYLNGQQYGNVYNNVNGVLPIYPLGSVSWRINRLNAAAFGDFFGDSTTYIAMIYNRALTSAEILQNYNATKSRFDL